jgi:hypothetical protein
MQPLRYFVKRSGPRGPNPDDMPILVNASCTLIADLRYDSLKGETVGFCADAPAGPRSSSDFVDWCDETLVAKREERRGNAWGSLPDNQAPCRDVYGRSDYTLKVSPKKHYASCLVTTQAVATGNVIRNVPQT